MGTLNGGLLENLLLTKAMCDYSKKEERFDSLNDVIDEVFADGALDRDKYLHSIMELTQLGYIDSDIESEEDIEMSEAVGYDIIGLTANGVEYINSLYNESSKADRVKDFFKKFDSICGSIADSGTGKLVGTVLLPLLGMFI